MTLGSFHREGFFALKVNAKGVAGNDIGVVIVIEGEIEEAAVVASQRTGPARSLQSLLALRRQQKQKRMRACG